MQCLLAQSSLCNLPRETLNPVPQALNIMQEGSVETSKLPQHVEWLRQACYATPTLMKPSVPVQMEDQNDEWPVSPPPGKPDCHAKD
eukprot:6085245-Amphidinium_carterae.1